MTLKIKQLLDARDMTQTALADRVGVAKGFISEIIAGKKRPSFETQMAIAEALDVDVGALFSTRRPIAVAGRVGAGSSVELVDAFAKGEGLYHIACPDDLPAHGIVAVEVAGDSMLPLIHSGDVLLFTRHFLGIDSEALGRVAICQAEDGRAMVKQLRKGRDPGTFDLFSLNTATNHPEYGVRLVWAAPYRRHLRREDVERL